MAIFTYNFILNSASCQEMVHMLRCEKKNVFWDKHPSPISCVVAAVFGWKYSGTDISIQCLHVVKNDLLHMTVVLNIIYTPKCTLGVCMICTVLVRRINKTKMFSIGRDIVKTLREEYWRKGLP